MNLMRIAFSNPWMARLRALTRGPFISQII